MSSLIQRNRNRVHTAVTREAEWKGRVYTLAPGVRESTFLARCRRGHDPEAAAKAIRMPGPPRRSVFEPKRYSGQVSRDQQRALEKMGRARPTEEEPSQ